MASQGADHVSQGDLMRRLRELERKVQRLETARRLESASIGQGGLTVNGGSIVIRDSDGMDTMTLSTDGLTLAGLLRVLGSIEIVEGEGITVEDGGNIVVEDGGKIIAEDESGTTRLTFDGDDALRYFREDGSPAMYLGPLVESDGLLGFDEGGDLKLSLSSAQVYLAPNTDGNVTYIADDSGQAWPPYPVAMSMPGVSGSTSSTSFAVVAEAQTRRMADQFTVHFAYASAGLGFDIQLYELFNDEVLETISLSGSGYDSIHGILPGDLNDSMFVQLRVRVTSGSGEVAIRPTGAGTVGSGV